eukprot:TRINITY_DN276_c0_g5_i1.p1 TRINITY_DN276_c0_g5~~TRINITY_DN276_c0_g5_i1.p1  ORF type:complete len:827 (+),score=247.51 TRINITY_DN276_c0_g5_i1:59-2482(+)
MQSENLSLSSSKTLTVAELTKSINEIQFSRIDQGITLQAERLVQLQQCLKREKVFEPEAKQKIETLTEEVQNNSNKLNTLLLCIRSMAKSIEHYYSRRVRAVQVEAPRSVPLTKQPVATIPPEIRENIVNFCSKLRNDILFFVNVIEQRGLFNTRMPISRVDLFDLADTIVFSLFNTFLPQEEERLLNLLHAIIIRQLDKNGHFLNDFVQAIVLSYFRSVDGYSYLVATFHDQLNEIISNDQLVLKSGITEENYNIYNHLDLNSPHFAQAEKNLALFMDKIVSIITLSLPSLPYGFRWLISEIKNWCHQKNMDEDKTFEIMRDFMFSNLFVQVISSPERFGITTNRQIPEYAHENLRQIALKFLNITDYVRRIFRAFPTTDPLETYFKTRPSSLQLQLRKQRLIISKQQIEQLQNLFCENNPSLFTEQTKEWLKTVTSILSIEVTYPGTEVEDQPVEQSPIMQQAKERLTMFLRSIDNIRGFPRKSAVELLKQQSACHWRFKECILSQLNELLCCLHQLPQKEQESDFQNLIDELFAEYTKRVNETRLKLESTILFCEQQKRFIERFDEHKQLLLSCLLNVRARNIFRNDETKQLRATFVNEFKNKFGSSDLQIVFDPIEYRDDFSMCEYCTTKSNMIRDLIDQFNLLITKYWSNVDEISQQGILRILMHSIYEEIYPVAFSRHPMESDYEQKRGNANLTIEDFQLSISDAESLALAIRELSHISEYKDPNDKCECILKMRAAIIKWTGATEPDALLAMTSYVIYQANPVNLISTILYITLFVTDYMLMEFVSGVQFLLSLMNKDSQ